MAPALLWERIEKFGWFAQWRHFNQRNRVQQLCCEPGNAAFMSRVPVKFIMRHGCWCHTFSVVLFRVSRFCFAKRPYSPEKGMQCFTCKKNSDLRRNDKQNVIGVCAISIMDTWIIHMYAVQFCLLHLSWQIWLMSCIGGWALLQY